MKSLERLAIVIREGARDCVLTPLTFDVAKDDLADFADDIVDPGWFLRKKCLAADHCQYF